MISSTNLSFYSNSSGQNEAKIDSVHQKALCSVLIPPSLILYEF